ncbi:hypothetical protein J3R03_004862 [Actinoplanes couchii]|uniref:hypothetical protein n=1 Tax=Actinoplanes couchii TaxID=403638 RepID=UPI0019446D5B|nr:hypothetical protein [Actinoplanes couchii]MDR6320666.1 hypothetical protein [Actinoplanes couchii]
MPVSYDVSARALKPLMATFWSASGWREPPVWLDPITMARAVADGVMFDRPRVDTHDGWVTAAADAAGAVSAAEVGDAFLESLSSRRLDLRSALGSWTTAVNVRPHQLSVDSDQVFCAVCGQFATPGEDLNVLAFERFKWGGVRHDSVRYAAFDLEQLRHAPRIGASAEDRELCRAVVAALAALGPRASMARSVEAIRMVPGSRAERQTLVEILRRCEDLHEFW